MFLDDNKVIRGLSNLKARFGSFGSFLTKTGGVLAGAGALALSPLTLAVESLNDLARQGATASALGLTAEQFTGIAGVAKSVGEDTREFIESLVTLGKVASEGAAGKGEVATQFFKDLNVNAQEFAALRSDEQFYKLFESLQTVTDPLKRVRLLMVAFGEDGGKYLLPLLEKSPQQLRQMAAGFAVSADDMKAAREAQLSYSMATTSIGRAWRQVVVAVAPAVSFVADWVTTIAKPVADLIARNKELVLSAVGIAAGVVGAGVALAGLGLVFKLAAGGAGVLLAVLGLVKGAILLLLSPVGLAVAAIVGLTVAWATMTDGGKEFVASLKGGFAELAEIAKTTWGGIVDALKAGDLQLAGEIALAGLKAAWLSGMRFLTEAWVKFKNVVVSGWMDMRDLIALSIIGWKKIGVLATQGRAAAEQAGEDEKKQLEQMRREEDKDRNKFRQDQIDAAKQEEADALRRLNALRGEAARKRAEAEKPKPLPEPPRPSMLTKAALADSVRGGFATPMAAQQFGYGSDTFQKRSLTAQENTAKYTAKTAEYLNDLRKRLRLH